jgi:hypothetical protein
MTKTHKNRVERFVFKKKDFYSGDGFLTAVWGPAQWHMLHTISFNYPINPTAEEKKQYMEYVLSLKNVLPCGACRKNLVKNFKKYPLKMKHMESRDSFSRYIYNLHEIVNTMLKKKSNLTYCDVRERYEHFRARCLSDDSGNPTFGNPETTFAMNANTRHSGRMPAFGKTRKTMKREKKTGEKGCTEPLYGKKSRCILNIVPEEEKGQSIQIDKKCIKTRD